MGFVAGVREIDFVSALRGWAGARARYVSRGLTVGEAPFAEEVDLATVYAERRGTEEQAALVHADFVVGRDGAALARLSAAWEACQGEDVRTMLFAVADRRAFLRAVERALPALADDTARLRRLLAWFDAAPPLDLRRALRGESTGMTAPVRRGSWHARALQSRAFDAWSRLWDATEGFNAPPERIAATLTTLGEEPGMSRTILQIVLPVLAQAMGNVRRLADRQEAVRGLVEAMAVHAETGRWPQGAKPAIRVAVGDETALLSSPDD